MRLDDLKEEFPKMPEGMKAMIEREVEKQIKTERVQFNRRKRTAGKVVAASLAAVLLFGTSVYAGVRAYRMQQEKDGDYGVKVSVAGEDDADAGDTTVTQTPESIPNIKMEVGYLPEGMVQTEEGKYSYEDARAKGGVSICFYRMNTGDDKFEVYHSDVAESENFTVNGFDGVYLRSPNLYEEEISFNQRIYVAYTDVHYVMKMYIASDVTKAEAMKIAQGIRVTPTEETKGLAVVNAEDWSSYQASLKMRDEVASDDPGMAYAVAKEQMANTHKIGERFSAEKNGNENYKWLEMQVSDVKVADDLSLLDPAHVDEDLTAAVGADGKILPATIQYIKEGGSDSLSEVVKERQVAQKLVYATVEYTNTGDKTLHDVLFFGNLTRICEKDGQMQICFKDSRDSYETPKAGDTWTRAVNQGRSSFWEMQYYDVTGGERGNNYIDSIQPGETVTVHMAWFVTGEELSSLYLSLDTFGGAGDFADTALAMGYVDIRQKNQS